MVDAVVDLFLGKILNTLEEKGRAVTEFQNQFQDLQHELQYMRCFLRDAERQKRKNEVLCRVIADMEELVSEAENILADCQLNGDGDDDDERRFSNWWLSRIHPSRIQLLCKRAKRLKEMNEKITSAKNKIESYLRMSHYIQGNYTAEMDIDWSISSSAPDPAQIVGLQGDKRKSEPEDLTSGSRIPCALSKAKEMEDEKRILKLYCHNSLKWDYVKFEHPSTLNTMAIDTELKSAVLEDLDHFIRRDLCTKVEKAWNRSYLLYGPPGTGKSTLVAAVANHLKFDVYDLQLESITCYSDLRRLLLAMNNRSILVLEDIDCTLDMHNRVLTGDGNRQVHVQEQFKLSGLLNFIDGLWSSCRDQRLIIFTASHKEKLDPALLRLGRMDMHVCMGYCTFQGFKILASNYLGLPPSDDGHWLYRKIESLIERAKVTQAQVAEELIKSQDADEVLEGVVKLLKGKILVGDDALEKKDVKNKFGIQEMKRRKLDNFS